MSEVQILDILDLQGKKAASVELPAEIFDVSANTPLMHQVVVAQPVAARQGTHVTKTHDMVSGGGKKPSRQKGIDNAHQGSIHAPHPTGGGIAHGSQPRDYDQRTSKKMKQGALRSILSGRARNGHIHAVTALIEGETPKAKIAPVVLRAIIEDCQAPVALGRNDEITVFNLRDVPEVYVLWVDQLNIYDVLDADDIVFTQAVLESFLGTKEETRWAPSKWARTPATSS